MLVGSIPSEGVVLESNQGPVFIYSEHKQVHTRGSGVVYSSDGSTSKTERVSESRTTDQTWLSSKSMFFETTLSSWGKPRRGGGLL